MKGSIRAGIGFLIAFGAVGGIENSGPEVSLVPMLLAAVVGLALMYSGVRAMNAVK